MSLLSVIQDVCAAVGVERPTSVFSGINANRTMQEMLSLANEMGARIAYDTRDWTLLQRVDVIDGTQGVLHPTLNQMLFVLPVNFKRMLLTTNIWRSTSPINPMMFILDLDQWVQRRVRGYSASQGEWILSGNNLYIAPALFPRWANANAYAVGDKVCDGGSVLPAPFVTTFWQVAVKHTSAATGSFADDRAANPTYWTTLTEPSGMSIIVSYLEKNFIDLASGGVGNVFVNDNDTFRLDERLLKLGMVFQWKALKGSPYAEDMATYETALSRVAGVDQPAPIIIGPLTPRRGWYVAGDGSAFYQ